MPTLLPCLAHPRAPAATLKKLTHSARTRRHQLILVAKADGIELLHWVRGWRGWALQRALVHGWAADTEKQASLAATLRAALVGQEVPVGTPVALVLANSIGGLSLLPDAATELAAVIPFQPIETIHAVLPPGAKSGPRSVFWLHRDSVQEYVDVLGTHGLRLVDIFSRAQMAAACLTPAELKTAAAVIEADGDDAVLHLYLSGGTPFRSTRLPGGDASMQRAGRVAAELATAAAHGQRAEIVLAVGNVALPDDFSTRTGAVVVAREVQTTAVLAGRLWFSPSEGIWLAPPRAELLAGFNRWAIGIAAVGAALYFAMLWQTDRYEKTSGEHRVAVKKLKPGYDKAVLLEQEALRSSETTRGVGDIENLPRVLDPLALLAEQLPAGVWLSGFTYRQGVLRVSGYAPDAQAAREKIAALPGISALRVVELPPAQEGAGTPFAVEGAWRAQVAVPVGMAVTGKVE